MGRKHYPRDSKLSAGSSLRSMGSRYLTDRTRKSIDWLHWAIVIIVYSATGSFSMLFSDFLLSDALRLRGEFWSGPWSYRIGYLLVVPLLYSVTLVVFGTLLGKHSYFKQHVRHMWIVLPRGLYAAAALVSKRKS